jgi:hypothetical protein
MPFQGRRVPSPEIDDQSLILQPDMNFDASTGIGMFQTVAQEIAQQADRSDTYFSARLDL